MPLPHGWVRSDEFKETGGGQAAIFPVRRRDGAETFALKRLKNRDNPARVDRFRREVAAVVRLRELGLEVVPVIVESELEADWPYFVMPWYREGSLQRSVEGKAYENTPIQALKVAIQIGKAIAQVHERGSAHRDLKPDNIFLTGTGIVLSDFGLCLDADEEVTRLTEPAEAVGSRLYIAPENESGINENQDQRPADLYAYGKIVWALLAGRVPFSREAFRHTDWRLSTLCSEPKLDKLDGFFGLTVTADVRNRIGTTWTTLLDELAAVIAAIEGVPHRPIRHAPPIEIARVYARSDRIRERESRDAQYYERLNWQHHHLMPAFTSALSVGPEAMQELQNASGNEFQFSSSTGWKPEYALVDFFPDFLHRPEMAAPGNTLAGARLTACTKSGDPELQMQTWSHVNAAGAWLAVATIIAYRVSQNTPPWKPEPQLPTKTLQAWTRLLGPLTAPMERSVLEAQRFGAQIAELFVGLANRYVVRVANGDDLMFGDDAEWVPMDAD